MVTTRRHALAGASPVVSGGDQLGLEGEAARARAAAAAPRRRWGRRPARRAAAAAGRRPASTAAGAAAWCGASDRPRPGGSRARGGAARCRGAPGAAARVGRPNTRRRQARARSASGQPTDERDGAGAAAHPGEPAQGIPRAKQRQSGQHDEEPRSTAPGARIGLTSHHECAPDPRQATGGPVRDGRVVDRATRDRDVQRRLRRAAHRPPAAGHPAAAGQGRRLGPGPLRRRLLQAAELDVARRARWPRSSPTRREAVEGVTARVDRPARQDRGPAEGEHPRGAPRHRATSSASTRAWSRTASRRTCSGCSPSTSTPSATAGPLIRREYMTAIGPVDILARDADGATVAIEIKRRGDIDGVEQLTRYLELMNRDPQLAPVTRHLRRPADQAAGHARSPRTAASLRHPRLRRPARRRRQRAPALLSASASHHRAVARPRPAEDADPVGVHRRARPGRSSAGTPGHQVVAHRGRDPGKDERHDATVAEDQHGLAPVQVGDLRSASWNRARTSSPLSPPGMNRPRSPCRHAWWTDSSSGSSKSRPARAPTENSCRPLSSTTPTPSTRAATAPDSTARCIVLVKTRAILRSLSDSASACACALPLSVSHPPSVGEDVRVAILGVGVASDEERGRTEQVAHDLRVCRVAGFRQRAPCLRPRVRRHSHRTRGRKRRVRVSGGRRLSQAARLGPHRLASRAEVPARVHETRIGVQPVPDGIGEEAVEVGGDVDLGDAGSHGADTIPSSARPRSRAGRGAPATAWASRATRSRSSAAVRSVIACELPTATARASTPVSSRSGRIVRVGSHARRVDAVLAPDLAELGLDADALAWRVVDDPSVTSQVVLVGSVEPSNITEVKPRSIACRTSVLVSAWSRCSDHRRRGSLRQHAAGHPQRGQRPVPAHGLLADLQDQRQPDVPRGADERLGVLSRWITLKAATPRPLRAPRSAPPPDLPAPQSLQTRTWPRSRATSASSTMPATGCRPPPPTMRRHP